jgi:hypothetical protein
VTLSDGAADARMNAHELFSEYGPTIWIDQSSLPRFDRNMLGRRPSSLAKEAGLRGSAVRVCTDFALCKDDDVLFLLDPARPLAARRTNELLDFVEQGGRLVMFVGPHGGASATGRGCFALWAEE